MMQHKHTEPIVTTFLFIFRYFCACTFARVKNRTEKNTTEQKLNTWLTSFNLFPLISRVLLQGFPPITVWVSVGGGQIRTAAPTHCPAPRHLCTHHPRQCKYMRRHLQEASVQGLHVLGRKKIKKGHFTCCEVSPLCRRQRGQAGEDRTSFS